MKGVAFLTSNAPQMLSQPARCGNVDSEHTQATLPEWCKEKNGLIKKSGISKACCCTATIVDTIDVDINNIYFGLPQQRASHFVTAQCIQRGVFGANSIPFTTRT